MIEVVNGAVAAGGACEVAVLHITEELDLATTPQLRAGVEQALAAQPRTLVVDLSACPFAGVDAIGVLVALTAQAQRQRTTLVLYGVRPIVRRALALLDLDKRVVLTPPAGAVPAPR